MNFYAGARWVAGFFAFWRLADPESKLAIVDFKLSIVIKTGDFRKTLKQKCAVFSFTSDFTL